MRELDDAVVQAYAHGTPGPASIPLHDVATLALPKGYVFVPAADSRRLMHGMGNAAGDTDFGVIIPSVTYSGWFIAVAAHATGHVDGATLAKTDPEEIRGTIGEAVRRGNGARMQLGSGPIDAGAFLEPPRFDAAHNSFTTAIRLYETGPSSGGEDTANILTALFGRSQTLALTLADGLSSYASRRPVLDQIAASVAFAPGQRSEDFVPGRDAAASHAVEQVFGGRSAADVALEIAEQAEVAKRIAALPPPPDYSRQIQLALFGALGAFALLAAILAFRRPRNDDAPRAGGIDRLERKRAGTA